MVTMLGVGDLSPFSEYDMELREAYTVRQTRSSSHASQQQRIDDAGLSSVPVADTSVPTVPSSVLVAYAGVHTTRSCVPAAATPGRRRTHLRFVSSTQMMGHNVERRYHEVPEHLECRFTEVISAVEALQEEVCKSDRERKESDRVREEQHKELVLSSSIGRQRDSAADSVPPPYPEDAAALPRVEHEVPVPQQDTIAGALAVDRPVWLRKRSLQTTTSYTDPCRRKKSKTETTHKFHPADPVHQEHLDAYQQFKGKRTGMHVVDRGNEFKVSWFEDFETNHAELEDTV
ncbi:hypothetical protein LWI29_026586 [Acer saccharum]|uniref:Uncharacterized protein n=1 Tax=Acer saccharum TaxID=4024 RepID=A0AA39SEM2_ACESA|nr:hypothetical protein LWI29_026586 [Acer saccharum]